MAGLEPQCCTTAARAFILPHRSAAGPCFPGHVGCRSPTSRFSFRAIGFEPTANRDYRHRPSSSLSLGGLSCFSWPPARRDTRLRYALSSPIDPCGIRTQPDQLERLATSPEVERAMSVCAQSPWSGTARCDCDVGWKALGFQLPPSAFILPIGRRPRLLLLVFSQALNRLSYQPKLCS